MPYHKNSTSLFVKKQSAVGTPADPAASDALAVLDLTADSEVSTSERRYAGVESREVETDIEDVLRSFTFSSLFPSSGGVAGSSPVLFSLFEAFGGAQVATATTAEATNAVPSFEAFTIEHIKHNTASGHKVARSTDVRGQTDLEIEIGKRAIFNSTIKGNYLESVQDNAYPTADYANQKTAIAQRVLAGNIAIAQLQPLGKSAVTAKNVCFGKLTASNFFGFDLERFLLSCAEGHELSPTAGEVKISIREEDAGVDYNPEEHLGDYHSFELVWGNVAGKTQRVFFNRLQLIDFGQTELGPWAGQDLTFKCLGYSSAKLL